MSPRIPPLRIALWVTSAVGLVFGARAILGAAPPVAWCVLGLAVHVALATLGVLLPSFGMFGPVYSRGPRERAELALTFDDGPDAETTPRVLELLREHGVRATFFVLGEKALRHPELTRAIIEGGHALGVHGHEHARSYALRSTRFVRRDVERACAAIESITGARPTLFRPPVGFVSPGVALAAERARLTLVGFTARTHDGRSSAHPARVLERATRALENGAILVLHDAAERGDHVPASLPVLGELLERIAARGLRAVTVDELRRPV